MRLRSIVCWSLLLVLASACSTQFKYGDTTYSTRKEAVHAAQNDVDATVAAVTPVSEPLGGRALVVIPTRTVIQAHGVVGGPGPDADSVQYLVDVLEIDALAVAEATRKGSVFQDVTVLRHDAPENVLYDTYDYKLWLFSGGPTSWQWYLSRKGLPEREPVAADKGVQHRERLNSFNKAVVRAGERLGSKPISMVVPTQ